MKEWVEKLGAVLGNGLGGAIFIGILVANVYGPYHAIAKHSTGVAVASVFIPPYAWYMATEGVLWHDDFADVDWDLRLKNDVRAVAALIGGAGSLEETSVIDHGRAVEEFAVWIQDYPEEKRRYLEDFGEAWLRYTDAIYQDMVVSLRSAASDGKIMAIAFSAETLEREHDLLRFKGAREVIDQFKLDRATLDQEFRLKGPLDVPAHKVEDFVALAATKLHSALARMKATYEDLFGHAPSN